jgi:hypothetical protein
VIGNDKHAGLMSLTGYPFSVLASAGLEGAARTTAERCERAHRFLAETLDRSPAFTLLVLSAADWDEHAYYPPPGMPHYEEGDLVVAGEATDFWQPVLDFVLAARPESRDRLAAVYGQPDGAIDLGPFFDLFVVHELGHAFAAPRWPAFGRLWLDEFAANLCLYAYLTHVEPASLPQLMTFAEEIAAIPAEALDHSSLADFDRLYGGVGPANFGWYHGRFLALAAAVVASDGPEVLPRLWRAFVANDPGELTDEALAARLRERVSPTLAERSESWPNA